MKLTLNSNWVTSLATFSTSSPLSHQYKPPLFHLHTNTNTHLVEKLRTCKELTSASSTHSKVVKSGLSNNTFTINNLIYCYLKLRRIDYAQKVFDEMPQRDVVSWNSLMSGYVNHGQPNMALCLFHQMQGTLVLPSEFTFSTLINACSILGNLEIGRRIHALCQVSGSMSNLFVCSSLIDMYGNCNHVDEARLIFDSMCVRNVVSWNSMINAYAQNAQGQLALQLFREFNHLRLGKPDHFTLGSAISACASLGSLGSGKVTHGMVIRLCHDADDMVASALVDMYAKCGCVDYSEKVFSRIPNPSVIHYTSMIVGAAKYGLATMSLQLFQEMIDRRIQPNDVTFVGVLHACSHSGLIDKGLEIFDSMKGKYGVMPNAKHYACIADMLGRVGRIEEAFQFAKSVEGKGNASLWRTLISASRLHGRVDIALEAYNRLIEFNQQVGGACVTLANTYALAGEWENALNLWSENKHSRICKVPASSWIEN